MVKYLLDTRDIESDLEDLILEKTEGIPFFIEEFVKSLRDLKVIERKEGRYHLIKDFQDLAIPSTIQDVIMARVDSLLEGAKEVLQTGSVIEREFSYELIRTVTGLPERELLSQLSNLKDSELLYERGIYPESTFIFKHALTREVVYDSILTRRKKSLHDEIGKAIEELYKNNIDEHYGLLVEHFTLSENYEKGAEFSRLAGRKAEKAGSLNDAISYASKRVACVEKLSQTEDVQTKLIDSRTILGLYYNQLNHHADAQEAIDPIFDLAHKFSYKRRLSQIYTIMGAYVCLVLEDLTESFKHLGEALTILKEIEDFVSLSLANYWLGYAQSVDCQFEKASYHFGKAEEINVARKSLWGISTIKSSLGYFVYDFQGRVNQGYQTTNEAVRIAEESGDIYSKACAYSFHGFSCFLKGLLEEAEEHSLKGVDLCEKVKLLYPNIAAHQSLGEIYFEIGEYQKSKHYYGKAVRLLERGRFGSSVVNFSKICIARAKVLYDEKDIDLESLYGYVHENKLRIYSGWIERYIGEILLKINDQHMDEVEYWIKKAIEADKRNGMMWHLGRDYALYAELLKGKGDSSKAKEILGKAIEILSDCGADGWVEKYEEEMASL